MRRANSRPRGTRRGSRRHGSKDLAPARQSAEAVNWERRQKLLEQVAQHGFVDDYQGVRISAAGKRFRIEQTTIWNVVDEKNVYRGQAAVIFHWSAL